ncbi:hypothetical protein NBRC116592_35970 [Colwellia sp. KU-HH00111]|uniref:hypothetical protein n=1 Tax=Colwellia sp. KU-HH00111 TaxID=3127652 RepID=UPI003107F48D
MNKTAQILLLILATFFFFIGIKSYQHSTAYTELTNIQTTKGTVLQLHCPPKGAAALSLNSSDATYNLSIKFRTDYCDNDKPQALVGKDITMKYVQVNDNFYQVYQLTENDRKILSPEEVEADQSSATFGLFLLAFLIIALVIYKRRFAKKP